MKIKQWVPWMMVVGRAALGPVLVLGQRCGWHGAALAAIVAVALLSDIFDGILARRWKIDTASLRLSDSLADVAFYVCMAAAVAFGMPAVWQHYRAGVLLVLSCEGLRLAFDFVKFGKPASYHSYLAKAWGLVLATALIVTLATQHATSWMTAAVLLGLLCNIESLAMSALLPVWRHDVKTLFAASRLRSAMSRERKAAPSLPIMLNGLGLLLAVTMIGGTSNARAQSFQHITYVGGTALQGNRLHGKLSVTPTDALIFEGPARLTILYDHVTGYESSTRNKVHVGLFTEGIWRLVAPWPEAKQVSLSYRDADDHAQVVVLEMSRAEETLLVEILKTRVSRPQSRQLLPDRHPTVALQNEGTEH